MRNLIVNNKINPINIDSEINDIMKYLRYYKLTKEFQYEIDVIKLLIHNCKPIICNTLGDAILKLGKSELNHMISSELSNPISWYNFTEKMIIN